MGRPAGRINCATHQKKSERRGAPSGDLDDRRDALPGSRWTLRSKLPEMVRQELWGILLTYNLVRYQMVKMAFSLKGAYLPYQLSFSGAVAEILRLLVGLPWASPDPFL